jgi:hypothetical protein
MTSEDEARPAVGGGKVPRRYFQDQGGLTTPGKSPALRPVGDDERGPNLSPFTSEQKQGLRLHTGGDAFDLPRAAEGPRMVPTLRNGLLSAWRPGHYYRRGVLNGLAQQERPGAFDPVNYVRFETDALAAAKMYWVSGEMMDVIEAVSPTIDPAVTPEELALPAKAGLAVFARPHYGPGSKGEPAVRVDAIVWGPLHLPPWGRWASRTGIAVSNYQMFDLDAGLDANDLQVMGSLHAEFMMNEMGPGVKHECLWLPCGRSDWPFAEPLDGSPWDMSPEMMTSFADDRRLVSAFFTFLASDAIEVKRERADREAERVTKRLAKRMQLPLPPPAVHVVRLRELREHAAPTGEGVRPFTHRWIVVGHMRRQAYGPNHSLRKLIYIPPHVKGPVGTPLIVRPTVHAVVR